MNIISELTLEIARIARMAEARNLDSRLMAMVQAVLRDARQSMALNSYEAMREALDGLREIGKQLKPEKPQE